MFSNHFIRYIEDLLDEEVKQKKPLTGGDINQVFFLETGTRKLVLKLNSLSDFPKMFEAEAIGLRELKNVNIFRTPNVIQYGHSEDTAFLLLEYIQSGKPVKNFWINFGEQLALVHQKSRPFFGFEIDNYIGNLPQYNTNCDSAAEFYITQRLYPQFTLASQKGFSFRNLDVFYNNIEKEIPKEGSSLIHGDLWNGNYIVDSDGNSCFIDPAVSYAPREMDIAMMHLFGGFDSQLFQTYEDIFPLQPNWKERIPLWQMYYLLVHLNIFGSSCYDRVKQILKVYT
ncbi:fructosamine kinase family protein [Aquimarina litoralis]|uniref:Fructosamine kinase family protein n=1 Tax=Aquimarina litoralis TaxID=584605 RepID=A0ABN1IMV3_9FLAO